MTDGTIVEALQNLIGGAATTIVGATAGRLMWHMSEVKRDNRKFLGWELVWELPIAFGMGLLGDGVTSYFDLDDTTGIAVIVGLAYLGPRGVEALLSRWLSGRR